MILAALEQVDLLAPPIVHADERAVAMDRPRDRDDSRCRGRPRRRSIELERILADAVALVDEGEDRRAAPLADGEELPRPLLDALAVVEQHDGAVGGDERAVGVLGEVLVARRVEQVDVVALVLELHHARRDRDAALLLELHPVGRGVPRGRRDLTDPARWMAPPYSRSFSVRVVLPASGWLMIAKVRRVRTASCESAIELERQRNYLHWRSRTQPRA